MAIGCSLTDLTKFAKDTPDIADECGVKRRNAEKYIEKWKGIKGITNPEELEGKVSKLLNSFWELGPDKTIVQSGKGQTDITLICTGPQATKFIFKVTKLPLIVNSQLCSLVFKQLEMDAPHIHLIAEKGNKIALQIFSSYVKQPSVNASRFKSTKASIKKYDFSFMKAFKGSNLEDLILYKRGYLEKSPDLFEAWKCFGKIALFDLITGNDDRFFRFSDEEKGVAPHFEDQFINTGNVMLELGLKNEVKKVFCIDNGSFNALSKSLDNPEFEHLVKLQAERFMRAFSHYSRPENHEQFAEAIYRGLDHVKMPLVGTQEDCLEALRQGIVEGCAVALEKSKLLLESIELFNKEGLGHPVDSNKILVENVTHLVIFCLENLNKGCL